MCKQAKILNFLRQLLCMDFLDTVITEPSYDAAVKYLNSFDKKKNKKKEQLQKRIYR